MEFKKLLHTYQLEQFKYQVKYHDNCEDENNKIWNFLLLTILLEDKCLTQLTNEVTWKINDFGIFNKSFCI